MELKQIYEINLDDSVCSKLTQLIWNQFGTNFEVNQQTRTNLIFPKILINLGKKKLIITIKIMLFFTKYL